MDQPQLYEIKKDSKGNYLYIKSDDIITLESKLKVFESFKNNKTLPRNLRVLDCVGVEIPILGQCLFKHFG
jgi:hypothetical protein